MSTGTSTQAYKPGEFDVTVKGNTDLKGEYLLSTASAPDNRLSTEHAKLERHPEPLELSRNERGDRGRYAGSNADTSV